MMECLFCRKKLEEDSRLKLHVPGEDYPSAFCDWPCLAAHAVVRTKLESENWERLFSELAIKVHQQRETIDDQDLTIAHLRAGNMA